RDAGRDQPALHRRLLAAARRERRRQLSRDRFPIGGTMSFLHRHRPRRSTSVVCGATAWALLCAAAPPPPYATRCATDRLSYYEGRVVADSGAGVANATITVHPTAAPLATAAIFADAAGQTPIVNLQADTAGRYRFYVAAGTYNLDVQSPS